MLFVLSPQDVRIPFLSRATRRPIPLTSACVMRSGKLDYAAFCELVMGSSSEDITSFAASPTRRMDQPAVLPGDARSFEVSVRRRVIDNWKDLKNLFTHLENLPVRSPQPTLASSWLVPDPEFVGPFLFPSRDHSGIASEGEPCACHAAV